MPKHSLVTTTAKSYDRIYYQEVTKPKQANKANFARALTRRSKANAIMLATV
jgi:hypothetical protein